MGTVSRTLRELVEHSDLIISFARRDIKARYKQTVFGVAWAIIQPLSWMLVFTLVFARLAQVPSDGAPYPLFAFSGLIFWGFFATTVAQGTIALTANAVLVRKIWFPRETLLLAVMMAAALDLAIGMAGFLLLALYYGHALTWTALWVLPLLLVQALFTMGVICATSALHAYFRDAGHAIPLALQLWMFATPIAYPSSLLPEPWRIVYGLNPMVGVVEGFRWALLGTDTAPGPILLASCAATIVLLVGGAFYFRWMEKTFADLI